MKIRMMKVSVVFMALLTIDPITRLNMRTPEEELAPVAILHE